MDQNQPEYEYKFIETTSPTEFCRLFAEHKKKGWHEYTVPETKTFVSITENTIRVNNIKTSSNTTTTIYSVLMAKPLKP